MSLAARLRAGNASSHARIMPILLRLLPRLRSAFPGVRIKLRGDAGFALPLFYEFCEFFDTEYAFGIPANCLFQRRGERRRKQLKRLYSRTQLSQRDFSSFRHRARSWPRHSTSRGRAAQVLSSATIEANVTSGNAAIDGTVTCNIPRLVNPDDLGVFVWRSVVQN
jgi:hypothetical protein